MWIEWWTRIRLEYSPTRFITMVTQRT